MADNDDTNDRMITNENFIIAYGYPQWVILLFTIASMFPIYQMLSKIYIIPGLSNKSRTLVRVNTHTSSTKHIELTADSNKSPSSSPRASPRDSTTFSSNPSDSKFKFKNTRKNSNKSKISQLSIPIFIKIVLLSYLLVSFAYQWLATFQVFLIFIPWPSSLNSTFCSIMAAGLFALYALGRSLIYVYFISRTDSLFSATAYAYNKWFIISFNSFAMFVGLFIAIPSIYAIGVVEVWRPLYIEHFGGFCWIVEDASGDSSWKWPLWFFGFLMEVVIAIGSMYILVSKVFDIYSKMADMEPRKKNGLILLVSRLLSLLFIAIVTTYFCLICLSFVSGNYVLFLYTFDTMINVYCLWFTFNFSQYYHNKYFCGKQCTKCSFPFVKTFAITCMDQDTNRCYICCCYCCILCCNKQSRTQQIAVYKQAKEELVELMLSN